MRFGVLLPHFGEHADGDKIVKGAQLAESLGFDSVWVRDHLLFEPHGEFEAANASFFDALTVLSVVGASTSTLTLGTGALIPFRHPLHTALIASTMTQFFGPRLILGFGTGNFDHEFEAVGLGGVPRPQLLLDNMEIMRRLWTEDNVSWDSTPFAFERASIAPKPVGGSVPLWYCGTTPKSARIAAAQCDGWMPGRISHKTLVKRMATLAEVSSEHGRPRPEVGMIPTASIADTRERALARVNVPGLLTWANAARFWEKPESGRFETVDDLAGVLIYGTSDDVIEQCALLQASGVDELVFDFRLSFSEWEEQMEMLGKTVFPALRSKS